MKYRILITFEGSDPEKARGIFEDWWDDGGEDEFAMFALREGIDDVICEVEAID